MKLRITRLQILWFAAVCANTVLAQELETEPILWPLNEVREKCIPVWNIAPADEAGKCTFVKFDRFTNLDEAVFYFAIYNDLRPGIPEYWRTTTPDLGNVLVLFKSDSPNGRDVTVAYVRKSQTFPYEGNPHSGAHQDSFERPRLIETELGYVLYSKAFGGGDGRYQYSYSEFLLWKSGDWIPLDATSWVLAVHMADGFGLDGAFADEIARAISMDTMTYFGNVRRKDDCHICATGGTVAIQLKWDQLTLLVASFEHHADGQYKSGN